MSRRDEMSAESGKVLRADDTELDTIGETVDVTIANGEALSGEIDFRGHVKLVIYMPSAWTAATLGFKSAPESGGTFNPLYDDTGNRVEVTVAASRVVTVDIEMLLGCQFLKLWSQDGSGVDVDQGAARSITIVRM